MSQTDRLLWGGAMMGVAHATMIEIDWYPWDLIAAPVSAMLTAAALVLTARWVDRRATFTPRPER